MNVVALSRHEYLIYFPFTIHQMLVEYIGYLFFVDFRLKIITQIHFENELSVVSLLGMQQNKHLSLVVLVNNGGIQIVAIRNIAIEMILVVPEIILIATPAIGKRLIVAKLFNESLKFLIVRYVIRSTNLLIVQEYCTQLYFFSAALKQKEELICLLITKLIVIFVSDICVSQFGEHAFVLRLFFIELDCSKMHFFILGHV